MALVSENINESSFNLKGTPPELCLGPLITYCSGIPSLLKLVMAVSPPSASRLASSLGTAVRYLDASIGLNQTHLVQQLSEDLF